MDGRWSVGGVVGFCVLLDGHWCALHALCCPLMPACCEDHLLIEPVLVAAAATPASVAPTKHA